MNMHRYMTAVLAAAVAAALPLCAQNGKQQNGRQQNGRQQQNGQVQEREVKTGWVVSALPTATYSSDLGFQYGAFGSNFYYGNGDTYPDPLHLIEWEASHFTKGRSRFYLSYDSKYLIPDKRITVAAAYINDPFYNFYGFNGLASYYDGNLASNKETGIAYYNMKRNVFKLTADMQGRIAPHLNWAAGLGLWNFQMDTYGEKYGYDTGNTIYNTYKDPEYSVIREKEAAGGTRVDFKAGFSYDTRDIEAAPNKGRWAEIFLNGSPDLFDNGGSYLKLCALWRQYISIPLGFRVGDPVFAYMLGYQGTIAGEVPFYMQQNVPELVPRSLLSEGFGSSKTLRGVYDNRIIADSFAWSKVELRVKLVKFTLFRQYFYIGANGFFDCGIVTDGYRTEEMSRLPAVRAAAAAAGWNDAEKYVRNRMSEFLYSAGGGLKLGWNQSFILSGELGHNFNDNLCGPVWINLGASYSF